MATPILTFIYSIAEDLEIPGDQNTNFMNTAPVLTPLPFQESGGHYGGRW